jgi:hypothetical protein
VNYWTFSLALSLLGLFFGVLAGPLVGLLLGPGEPRDRDHRTEG